MKKAIALALSLVMLFISTQPLSVFAKYDDDPVYTGTSGVIGHYSWSYDSSAKTLTVRYSEATGNDGWDYYKDSIETIIVNEGVTELGDYRFQYHDNLKTVSLPDSLVSLGEYCFDGCTSLVSVNLPSGLNEIPYGAFMGCSALKTVTVPSNVKTICQSVFSGCTSLTTLNLKEGVQTIEKNAFYGCSALTAVTIPASVTTIGYTDTDFDGQMSVTNIFAHCDNLKSLTVNSNNKVYDSRNGCNGIIETKTNTLISANKYTVIPNSIKQIGTSVFAGCSNLTTVTIPDGVKVGYYSFANCTNLKTVKFHKSVGGIEYCAFRGTAITDVYYEGTKGDWDNIYISNTGGYNDALLNASFHYNAVIDAKKANTLTVKAKKPTVKYSKLKKKNQTVARKKAITVSNAQGTVTYAKSSGNKKITINKKTGKITVKKGLKKGTYKVKIKVKAAGNASYKAATKTVTVTIKVK